MEGNWATLEACVVTLLELKLPLIHSLRFRAQGLGVSGTAMTAANVSFPIITITVVILVAATSPVTSVADQY